MKVFVTAAALTAAAVFAGPARGPAEPVVAPAECVPSDPVLAAVIDRYDGVILEQSRRRGLNPRLVKAVIATESQFTPGAVSNRGARGLMQVMPDTSRELGVPAWALSYPEPNISVGAEYLSRLDAAARRDGKSGAERTRSVIAAYHAGPRALRSADWPASTRRYVGTVLTCYNSPVSALRVGTTH